MRSQPKPFPRTRPFILEQLFSLASENYSSGTLTNKKIENTQKSFCYTCTCPPTAIQSLFWIYDPKAEAPTRGNPFRHIFFFLFLSSLPLPFLAPFLFYFLSVRLIWSASLISAALTLSQRQRMLAARCLESTHSCPVWDDNPSLFLLFSLAADFCSFTQAAVKKKKNTVQTHVSLHISGPPA